MLRSTIITALTPILLSLSQSVSALSPFPVSIPAAGSNVELYPALKDRSGLLSNAISVMLSADAGGEFVIVDARVTNDALGLFGATVNGLKIDLTVDVDSALQLPLPSSTRADLLVITNGGNLDYTISLTSPTVPEPNTLFFTGLGLFSLVGARWRRRGFQS